MKWQESDCWLWARNVISSKCDYGKIFINGKYKLAHRVVYESLVGPIPEGMDMDHLCRVPRCVNPQHLEPVTRSENVRRGMAGILQVRVTECPYGHPYTTNNTYVYRDGRRKCRACAREYNRVKRAKVDA